MAKMFYTVAEAAKVLQLPEEGVVKLGRQGRLQEFMDRDKLLFKVEQVNLLATVQIVAEDDLPEKFVDKSKDLSVDIDAILEKAGVNVNKSSRHENIMLGVWVLCGVLFLVGVFARRMYLLEFVVPTLGLVGFIMLGMSLLNGYKAKQKAVEARRSSAETEHAIRQAERLQNLSRHEK